MGGAEWLEDAAGVGLVDPDVRRVHGTVSMLADGNVRWSIVRDAILSLNDPTTVADWGI